MNIGITGTAAKLGPGDVQLMTAGLSVIQKCLKRVARSDKIKWMSAMGQPTSKTRWPSLISRGSLLNTLVTMVMLRKVIAASSGC